MVKQLHEQNIRLKQKLRKPRALDGLRCQLGRRRSRPSSTDRSADKEKKTRRLSSRLRIAPFDLHEKAERDDAMKWLGHLMESRRCHDECGGGVNPRLSRGGGGRGRGRDFGHNGLHDIPIQKGLSCSWIPRGGVFPRSNSRGPTLHLCKSCWVKCATEFIRS